MPYSWSKFLSSELLNELLKLWDKTYVQDGKSINEIVKSQLHPMGRQNKSDLFFRLAGFFGLPNRKRSSEPQRFRNLMLNFIGYDSDVAGYKKTINSILMPLTITLNVVNLPFRLMTNLLKLATEILPGGINLLLKAVNAKLTHYRREVTSPLLWIETTIVINLLSIFSVISMLVYQYGRSVTSPIHSMVEKWEMGSYLADQIADKYDMKMRNRFLLSTVISTCLSLSSILTSIVTYSILLPLAGKLLGGLVINATATHLPTALSKIITAGVKALSPIFSTIGQGMRPVVNQVANGMFLLKPFGLNPFGLNISMLTSQFSNSLLGLASTYAMVVTTIGRIVGRNVDGFKAWWHKPAPVIRQHTSYNRGNENFRGSTNVIEQKLGNSGASDALGMPSEPLPIISRHSKNLAQSGSLGLTGVFATPQHSPSFDITIPRSKKQQGPGYSP